MADRLREYLYRVQRADGRGPWIPGFSHQWVDAEADAGPTSETLMDVVPLLSNLPQGFDASGVLRSRAAAK